MKLFKTLFLVTALSSAMAADDSMTGTITFSGLFSPNVTSIKLAVKDCGDEVTYATCAGTLNTASFTGHTQDATLALADLDSTGELKSRFVQFEVKSNILLFKNDYMQLTQKISESNNDIDISLRKLTFVTAGSSTFGQQTLGSGANVLALNEDMIDSDDLPIELTTSAQTVYDQTVDSPGVTNGKVIAGILSGNELVMRGILEISVGEEATSEEFETEVEFGIVAKDN